MARHTMDKFSVHSLQFKIYTRLGSLVRGKERRKTEEVGGRCGNREEYVGPRKKIIKTENLM